MTNEKGQGNVLKVACCTLIFFLMAGVVPTRLVWAQEKSALDLGEIIVTGTRDSEETWNVPANSTVITAEEIQASGVTTVPEALEKLGGIHFRDSSSNGAQAQIDLRGFGEQSQGKTLILVDGKRLNPPDMAQIDWLQVPLESIEKIEVIRGANTVLYGDNAVAGVVNIITKRGTEKPALDMEISGGSNAFFDSQLSARGSQGRLSYFLTGQNEATDGYRERSGFRHDSGGLNLGYQFNDRWKASLDVSYATNDYKMPGYLTKTQLEQDPRQAGNPNDDIGNENLGVNFGLEAAFNQHNRFDVNILYGNKNVRNNFDSFWAWSNVTVGTFAVTPRYILEAPVLGKDNKLIMGLDYYQNPIDSDRFSSRARTTTIAVSKIVKDTLGYYIHDEYQVLNDLSLTLGYRYESSTINADDNEIALAQHYSDSKNFTGNVGNLAFNYQWGKKVKVYARYDQVYRYPFTDEIAYYQGFLGGPWPGTVFFNKDLRPEQGASYELGGEYQPRENLKLGLTVFNIDLKDEIYYNPVAGINENLYKTRRFGAELTCFYAPHKRVNVNFSYTYVDPKFASGPFEGKKIPLVPSNKGTLGISFYLPRGLTLETDVTAASSFYLGSDFDNNQKKLPGYAVVDLYAHYRPERFEKNKLHFFVGVENLLNQEYSTLGFDWGFMNVYYPAPGRTFKGGVSIEF